MYNDNIGQDGISERKAQFEKGMATIASSYQSMTEIYRAKAEIDMEQIRANIEGITEKQNKTELLLQEVAEGQKKTDKLMRQHETNWGRLVESLVEGSLVELLNGRGIEVHRTHPRQKVSYVQQDGTRKEQGVRYRGGERRGGGCGGGQDDTEAEAYQAVRRVDEGFFKVFSVLCDDAGVWCGGVYSL